MPFAVGISLISLNTGSPVTVHIIPITSDGDTTAHREETIIQPILNSSDLSSTFAAISAVIPEETVQTTLAVPSHIAEPARKPIVRAAHKIRIFRKIWVAENIQLVKRQLDLDPGTPNRNELFIEITPDMAFSRLDHTEVEEGIRSADTLKRVCVSLPQSSVNSGLVAALVDPIVVELKTSPTPSGSDVKNIIITGATDEALVTALSEKIKTTFVGGKIISVPSDYARYAAQYSFYKYQDSLHMDQMFITNVVPLRVGIKKADGFVLTALQRNSTLPQNKSLFLTTSTDNQRTATVTIVAGISPVSKDNIPIAELVLENLKPRPQGETMIKVSFSVEQLGKTTIIAEELGEDGNAAGARAYIELEDVLGNDLFSDDVEDALEGLASLGGNPAAMEAEDRWAGERAQGDLPK